MKIALCQMKVGFDKKQNIAHSLKLIREARENGAKMIILPEMFQTPYSNDYFREYGEEEKSSETLKALQSIAKELGVFIIGGSFAELHEDRVYNTSYIINEEGEVVKKHRKIHLFDIDVKGGIRFMESDTLTGGDEITVVDSPIGKIGVAICYDIRFPELFRAMNDAGAIMTVIPGAFNMTTGPLHWELLIRGRAVDYQQYMVAVSPARDEEGPYVAYGHSMAVDPWGNILTEAGPYEEIRYFTFDESIVNQMREAIPVLKQLKIKA